MFITLEGIDGAGKTTLARGMAEELARRGREVVLTREPGGSPGAEEIRSLIVTGDADRWSPKTELLLFNAARRDHVERVIRPAIDRGAVVICDRYVDSSRAYQGQDPEMRGIIDRLHDMMIGLNPDRTLVLDLPPRVGLARGLGTEAGEARFESFGGAFMERARNVLLGIAVTDPDRVRVIDADRAFETVLFDALNQIA